MKRFISLLFISLLILTVFCSCGITKEYVIVTDNNFAPFSYSLNNGELNGFDIDLITNIAKTENFKTEIIPVSLVDAFEAVDNDEADAIIAAVTPTKELSEKYDFSDEYFDGFVLAVKKGENSSLIKKFNSGLNKLKTTGLLNSIIDKYALGDINE